MARTRKFIAHPSDERLAKFPKAVRDLIKKGKEHRFVTQHEILKAVPNLEEDVDLLDELYGIFYEMGIEVVDVKEALVWKGAGDEKELEGEETEDTFQ